MRTMNVRRMVQGVGVLLAISASTHAAERVGVLRKEIARAENAFYALYNQLNTDRQYDVICANDRPTGSKFEVRVCQPRYLEHAKQVAASERMAAATRAGDSSGAANSRGPDVGNAASPVAETGDRQQAFRRNMLEVLQKSPELQELGRKRDELQARYEAATKGR